MQSTIIISIDKDIVRFLVNDDTRAFLGSESVIRRASHVEPVQPALRLLFHALRFVFGEYGRCANFTRQWRCIWRVNLSPSAGPILDGRWQDRQKAIQAEIDYLNSNFI